MKDWKPLDLRLELLRQHQVSLGITQFYTWLRFAYIKEVGKHTRWDSYSDRDRAKLLKLGELYLKHGRRLKPASLQLFELIEQGVFDHYDD